MSTQLIVNVHLDWTGKDHYDRDHSKPCRICGTDTKMRDKDLPVHQDCREDEIARELYGHGQTLIADERVGAGAGGGR